MLFGWRSVASIFRINTSNYISLYWISWSMPKSCGMDILCDYPWYMTFIPRHVLILCHIWWPCNPVNIVALLVKTRSFWLLIHRNVSSLFIAYEKPWLISADSCSRRWILGYCLLLLRVESHGSTPSLLFWLINIWDVCSIVVPFFNEGHWVGFRLVAWILIEWTAVLILLRPWDELDFLDALDIS
jgi:hypothetical protein